MAQLTIDENISSDVLNAIQTILNAFTKVRKDRDDLLDRIKCLETEKQEYFQKRDASTSTLDCSTMEEPINQPKRIKTEFENEEYTNYDTSKDELNAAFHSTSIEDDVVEPTQCEPYQSGSKKSKKISPSIKGHCSNEQNKENQNKNNLKVNEKSPTVLSKNSKKTEIKVSYTGNESPKWRSKVSTKANVDRRIFENSPIQKDALSESKNQTSLKTRKRPSLSFGLNTTRLKQSTLNFSRYEDETYCEGVSCQIDDHKKEMNKNLSTEETRFQLNSMKLQYLPTQYDSKHEAESTKSISDESVAFVKCLNEVITIEESQPTQELFKHIVDIKEELRKQTSPEPVISSKKAKNFGDIQKSNLNCADCLEYHRMLGRDLKKDFPRKFGVCSKHHRNVHNIDTPEGFWNPTIVDSPKKK